MLRSTGIWITLVMHLCLVYKIFFHSSRNIAYSTCRSSQIQMLEISDIYIKAFLLLYILKTQSLVTFYIDCHSFTFYYKKKLFVKYYLF